MSNPKNSKKTMKTIRLLSMAALALLTAACTTDDIITGQSAENGKGIPFTATLSNGGSATRATLSGPNSSNVITATWDENDEVALVYKVGDETKVTKATVTAVSDGTATITAELDAGVATGTDVTLIYPYSAVNTSGENIGKVRDDVFKGQAGTLAYISANCDLRKGEGKITLSTGSATLKNNVTMASQIAIWILSLKDNAATPNNIIPTKFDVYFGGMTSSVTTGGMTSHFCMAVPAGTGDITFFATTTNSLTNSYYIYNKSSVTLNASTWYNSEVRMTKQTTRTITAETGELTLNDGDIVTGTGGANTQLKIADGATVTLAGVTNNSITINNDIAGIKCEGDATIILADGTTNTLKGRWGMPCIYIPSGKTLTIRGGGTLIADNSDNTGAGIGGGYSQDCGNIVIEGGKITAKGGSYAAGIGGGNGCSCGTITIKGGTINATGDYYAAGIGNGEKGSCGAITISGGTITAMGDYGAGIGSGFVSENETSICGDITITGGTIVAKGTDGAGIGCGYASFIINGSTCGDITISNTVTKVTARKNIEECSIGKTSNCTCGTVTIGGTEYWGEDPDSPGEYIYKNEGDTYLGQNELVYPAP